MGKKENGLVNFPTTDETKLANLPHVRYWVKSTDYIVYQNYVGDRAKAVRSIRKREGENFEKLAD
jgi:hypothetical protein